ncbi:MAG: hypothetical protein JXA64_01835 [Candidatus Fermentibacteraceae bacterium]|nr:hypothetical protein [Candidatus Fermentibacteraceae bacterium]MBN2607827.1 hypothetical protein [Candidatus Fermentibacteraceae bacterium]
MRNVLTFAAILLISACRTDYDIEEVATAEFLGQDHVHADSCETCGEETTEVEHDHPEGEHVHDPAGSDRHIHEAGVRNHGTEWFFNQPWAADFIWGKMVRDSVILVLLATGLIILSGYRRKNR